MLQKTISNRSIFCGDNIDILKGFNSNSVDLIYLDPPFNKNKLFIAPLNSAASGAKFKDTWGKEDIKNAWLTLIQTDYPALYALMQGIATIGLKGSKYYLIYIAMRLIELHRILKETGSLYLHCDPTMSHYLKLLLDSIFGAKNFRNEICWCYGGRGMSKRWFARKHDIIFFYVKNERQAKFYSDQVLTPIAPEFAKRYNKVDDDGNRYARVKNRDGSYSKIYFKEEGRIFEDFWKIPFVRGREYVGYPTQKPIALIERIIRASSAAGDVILDPFCGCATTCVAAEKLNREWIGIDISRRAYELVQDRLAKEVTTKGDIFKSKNIVHYKTAIPDRDDLNYVKLWGKHKLKLKQKLYQKQGGVCVGCETDFAIVHFEIDHIIPKSKGGQDAVENLQLICSYCNRVKGNRGMEYLRKRLEEIEATI